MRKLTLILLLPLFFACVSTRVSDPSRFYTLMPQTLKRPSVTAQRPISIGIENVSVPGYIDRPQIVVRQKDSSEVSLSDFDRWAEPLRDALPRLIVQNMMVYASNIEVGVMRTINRNFDYRVTVDIIQFDAVFEEKATMEATFFITDRSGKYQKQGRTNLSLNIDHTYPNLVEQEGRLIAKLSNDIINEVITLDKNRKP